ncbi:hypothetical protein BCR43DRAFT_496059 [Syncephalastrum racemosum]|uniref:Uncharacterized protein n=1 Tax=Syncephalastrum racemosum TaxID=13706 RepID=A0A1X2H6X0_SYNRA|nr:hypothetical protein BCR43DRAFT_496059 [Syncephalastrum racemosum]
MHGYYLPPPENSQSESTALEESLPGYVSSDNTSSEHVNQSHPQGQKRSNENDVLLDDIHMNPPRGKHLVIDEFDVTNTTYCMKFASKDHRWKLSLEDYLRLVLASTSVLLLTPEIFPNGIQPYFGHGNWAATISVIENIYNIRQTTPIPIDVAASLLSIIDDLIRLKLDRDAVETKLGALQLPKNEKKKSAKVIAVFISKLPTASLDGGLNGCELCSRFIDPALSGLFDDPDQGIYKRWTNGQH